MLQNGSAALQEQIGMVDKYGATIKDTEGAKEMIARQREMKIAMDGLKISLGTALMPAIEQFVGVLLKVVSSAIARVAELHRALHHLGRVDDRLHRVEGRHVGPRLCNSPSTRRYCLSR
jgi:hypothetical protein